MPNSDFFAHKVKSVPIPDIGLDRNALFLPNVNDITIFVRSENFKGAFSSVF